MRIADHQRNELDDGDASDDSVENDIPRHINTASFFVAAESASMASAAGQPSLEDYLNVTNRELTVLRRHTVENTTTFSSSEAAHLIHLFEQAIRCYHCGRHRFVIIATRAACTCDDMGRCCMGRHST